MAYKANVDSQLPLVNIRERCRQEFRARRIVGEGPKRRADLRQFCRENVLLIYCPRRKRAGRDCWSPEMAEGVFERHAGDHVQDLLTAYLLIFGSVRSSRSKPSSNDYDRSPKSLSSGHDQSLRPSLNARSGAPGPS
jgi:hypothetical protein